MKFLKIFIIFFILFVQFFFHNQAMDGVSYLPSNVNMEKIREKWIQRHNQERKTIGLHNYTGSKKLDETAQKRAEYLASINKATHQRKNTDGYYNYKSIKAWFTGQNINFPTEKTGIPNFSENIAYQYYKCNKNDCTEELTKAIKKGFDFFMSEKKKKSQIHYKAIINKHFKIMGMGIGITGTRYYIVTHYATEIQ